MSQGKMRNPVNPFLQINESKVTPKLIELFPRLLKRDKVLLYYVLTS